MADLFEAMLEVFSDIAWDNLTGVVEEDERLLPLLREINSLGFFTDNSQDGLKQSGGQREWRYADAGSAATEAAVVAQFGDAAGEDWDVIVQRKYTSYCEQHNLPEPYYCNREVKRSQRAFLSGFTTRKTAMRLWHFLNAMDYITCTIMDPASTEPIRAYRGTAVTYQQGAPQHSSEIVGMEKLPLTTYLSPSPFTLTNLYRPFVEACEEWGWDMPEWVWVDCADTRHGHPADAPDGLFTTVLSVLQSDPAPQLPTDCQL